MISLDQQIRFIDSFIFVFIVFVVGIQLSALQARLSTTHFNQLRLPMWSWRSRTKCTTWWNEIIRHAKPAYKTAVSLSQIKNSGLSHCWSYIPIISLLSVKIGPAFSPSCRMKDNGFCGLQKHNDTELWELGLIGFQRDILAPGCVSNRVICVLLPQNTAISKGHLAISKGHLAISKGHLAYQRVT